MSVDSNQLKKFVDNHWDQSIIPALSQYITIPCKSPAFDKNWQEHGYLHQAVDFVATWCRAQEIPGLQLMVHGLAGRTPLILLDIPGQLPQTVLLYGHLDKQPEMTGWHEGLSPWQPVIKDNRLYGRGGADDGYAVFAALTAIKALQQQNLPHARCLILIEASEESGSYDLPFYMDHLADEIGEPDMVVCLDSGMGNYQQFWSTASLRGLVSGVLSVDILTEGVHSGAAGGVVPSSFRIMRELLSRVEDEKTGRILLDEFYVEIPQERIAETHEASQVLGDEVWKEYPWIVGAKPAGDTLDEMILNRTWRPSLEITGMDDIPTLQNAGNVLRPKTQAMLSLRIPPTCNPKQAAQALKKTLEANPPHQAKVSFTIAKESSGWNAPKLEEWLAQAIGQASTTYFGKPAVFWGEGGSIPFMHMLGEKFPRAQFVITGVLGPHSNAHGPNEFLDIPTGKRVTCCIAELLFKHYQARNS